MSKRKKDRKKEADNGADNESVSPFAESKQKGKPYRNIKDSLFKSVFSSYLPQVYKALHPEDRDITEADLELITLETVLVKGMHNDLGFAVKDKLVILVEAQSTWSLNIVPRCFFYLAQSYQDYLEGSGQNPLRTKRVKLPRAELYVVYTGKRRIKKQTISLVEDFFNGEYSAVDVRVKVITGTDGDDIIQQYITCCGLMDEQINIYGREKKAVEEAIRICKEKNILKEFFEQHEKEMVDMMKELFTQEKAVIAECRIQRNEGFKKGQEKGREEGREEGQEKERENGIRNMVATLSKYCGSEEIAENLISAYSLTPADAEEKVKKYLPERG